MSTFDSEGSYDGTAAMPAATQAAPQGTDTGPELTGDPWRVLLVDDRSERRSIVRLVLGTDPPPGRTEVVVVEASTVAGAVAEVRRQPVDAAIVEIQMPTDVGIHVIEALRAAHPSLVIVVCSFHVDQATRLRASLAGADAFLGKPASRRELVKACWSPHGESPSLLPTPSP